MTGRKPAGMSFPSWIDQQINEAAERGAFDHLPGAGKAAAAARRNRRRAGLAARSADGSRHSPPRSTATGRVMHV